MGLNTIPGIVLVLSELAAVVGAVLGVYNYCQNKKSHDLAVKAYDLAAEAPKREDQRNYRAQLREVLHELERQFKAAMQTLKFGDELADDVPEYLDFAQKRINELTIVITAPRQVQMYSLDLAVDRVVSRWKSQKYEKPSRYPGQEPSDKQNRRYDAVRQELRENLDLALTKIEELIQQTVAEDNK
jgi:hypothetical protein